MAEANVTKKDIGLAFVKIQPSMEGFAPKLKKGVGKALVDVNKSAGAHGEGLVKEYADSAEAASSRGVFGGVASSLKGKLASTLRDVATSAGVVGAGALIAKTVGSSIQSAVERYKTQDMFRLQLEGMGYSPARIKAVSDTLNTAVMGTFYTLSDAMKVGNQYILSNRSEGGLAEYFNAVKTLAVSTGAELTNMGTILNKVNAIGHLTGEVVMQLNERGASVYKTLSQYLNMSVSEVQAAITKGQVSYQDFINAINSDQALKNVAASVGTSLSGNLANIKAAFTRIISEGLTPIFNMVNSVLPGLLAGLKAIESFIKSHAQFLGIVAHTLGLIAGTKAFAVMWAGASRALAPMRAMVATTVKQAAANVRLAYTGYSSSKAMGALYGTASLAAGAIRGAGLAVKAFAKSVAPLIVLEGIILLITELDKRFHIISKTMKFVGDVISWLVNFAISAINKIIQVLNAFNRGIEWTINGLGRLSNNKKMQNFSISTIGTISSGGGSAPAAPSAPAAAPDYSGVPSPEAVESASSASLAAQETALNKQQQFSTNAAKETARFEDERLAEEKRAAEERERNRQEMHDAKVQRQEKELDEANDYRQKALALLQAQSEQALDLAQPFNTTKTGKAVASSISSNLSNAFSFGAKALDFAKLVKDPAGYTMDLLNSVWDMSLQRAGAAMQSLSSGISGVSDSAYAFGKDLFGVSDFETLGLADKAREFLPNAGEVVGAFGNAGMNTAQRITGSDAFQKGATDALRPIVVNGYSSDDVAQKIAYEQRLANAQWAGVMS